LILSATRVVFPDGVRPATIHIQDGRIVRVDPYDRSANASAERDLVISPGIVDTHVHVNEPGRTDWEGFDTATRAAAAGGVTTIVDMPLNSIPATTTVAALETKRAAARGRCHVDVAFWGGVVPGNALELDALVDAGVLGFKCFLTPSGVDEFENVGESDLRDAMPIIAKRGVPLLVHAELPAYLTDPTDATYQTFLASRPPEAEVAAIAMVAGLAREFGAHVHIVHVASAQAADEVRRAKVDAIPITAETCPHYLTFAAEDVPEGATEFKCAPPIRDARHRDALWNALQAGVLDLVATDHSPAPPALKCPGDFVKAWGGIPSLELSLAALWNGAGARRLQPSDLARWMSEAPARLAGLDGRKGRIAVGLDADLVVWDPDAEREVDPRRLQQRHKLTPYAGRRLRGVVHSTFVRGVRVWQDERLVAGGTGQPL
jgi:allantoinase